MVIVRCIGPEEFFLERVVFPFELLSFLAPPETIVQIWTHGLGGPELVESLDAEGLLVEAPAEPQDGPLATSGLRHLEAVADSQAAGLAGSEAQTGAGWGEAV